LFCADLQVLVSNHVELQHASRTSVRSGAHQQQQRGSRSGQELDLDAADATEAREVSRLVWVGRALVATYLLQVSAFITKLII
jgi:hypothetical protein